MELKDRFKQIGKDSVVYGLGGIMAKSISFFLIPVYTRIFSPADYGTIEMLIVLNGFLSAVLNMGMDSAQSFYFFEQKKQGHKVQAEVVTAILQWRLVWGTLIVLLATLCSPVLNKFFFSGRLGWEYFAITFSAALFAQLFKQSVEVFRLLFKPWAYISITFFQTFGSAAVALFLIIILNFGIKGFLIGMLGGSACAAGIGWWQIKGYFAWNKKVRAWWPKILKFGAPLVPATLAEYLLNTADRWFVSYYHGQDALGIYSVGAKFAMLMVLVVTTFRQAWWPVAMDAMHAGDGKILFRTIARLYLGLGIACVVLLTAVSPWLVRWFTAPAYHSAYPIVGILAWHAVFFGFLLICSVGIWKAEKTKIAPLLSGGAALLNIFLDYILVPRFGAVGAAVGTSVSFLAWSVLTLICSEYYWYVGYSFLVLSSQILVGLIAVSAILINYCYYNNLNILFSGFIIILTMPVLCFLSVDRKTAINLKREIINYL